MARTGPNLPAHLADARLQLPWGGQPLLRSIEIDSASQTFFLGGFDVSEWIPAGWVHYWPGFDLEAFNGFLSNRRLDSQGRYVSELGPTGTVSAFFNGIWQDVEAIGAGIRRAYQTLAKIPQNIADTAEKATRPINLLIILGVAGLAYLALKQN